MSIHLLLLTLNGMQSIDFSAEVPVSLRPDPMRLLRFDAGMCAYVNVVQEVCTFSERFRSQPLRWGDPSEAPTGGR